LGFWLILHRETPPRPRLLRRGVNKSGLKGKHTMSLKDILPGKLGFGAAPLGNMFRVIPVEEALATVEAAWDDGIRYFDNAPLYGAGLAEIRMGHALAGRPRDQYVISTKVSRVILDEVEDGGHARCWREGRCLQVRPPEQDREQLFGRGDP
jgi:aryl-alcohol dehydrogenase-like predicted oxidoreductase